MPHDVTLLQRPCVHLIGARLCVCVQLNFTMKRPALSAALVCWTVLALSRAERAVPIKAGSVTAAKVNMEKRNFDHVAAFHADDKNGDGQHDLDELTAHFGARIVATNLHSGLNDAQALKAAASFMEHADKDGDGKLSLAEFASLHGFD